MNVNEKTGLVPLTLLRAYDKFNKGETAGFLPEVASKLVAAGVAKPFDPNATVEVAVDPAADALAAVAADLSAREAQLAEREAALAEREKALAAGASSEPAKADAGAGAPPKQGK